MSTTTATVNIYAQGLCACSVCAPADLTREQIEQAVNVQMPTGIDSEWKVADEPFKTGEPNPFDAEGCGRHWLLHC